MPFTPTTDQPDIGAKVTVTFSGQMLLRPGRSDTGGNHTCEVGINRYCRLHKLNVLLLVHKPGKPPTIVPLLKDPLTRNFVIRRYPEPASADFRVFKPTEQLADMKDYRWSINIRDIHPNAEWNEGAEPVVQLKTGTLYAPTLTRDGMNPKYKRNGLERRLIKVAPSLAVSIPLAGDQKLRLSWEEFGDPYVLQLPRDSDNADQDTKYTVAFVNDPPYSMPEHDELALYYKILCDRYGEDIPPNEQWHLEFDDGELSDEIPCLPGRLDP